MLNTESGADIPFPVLDDTSNSASGPTAENTDVGAASDPSVSQLILKSYMTTSGVLKVSRQFLRDSVIPAEQWLNNALVERISVKQNALFTTGTGSSQPQGIVTGAGAGVHFINLPSSMSCREDAITINYTAGYGNPEDVPALLVMAIKQLVGTWFANRESVVDRQLPSAS